MLSVLNPIVYSQAFGEGAALLTRHWRLTVEMAKRDLLQRHAGQVFGAFWIIGHPLFLTALYLFVFAVVFKQKIGNTYELPLDYTTYILAGLVPWLTFQAALTASCSSIVANSSLVKQFVFHLEILPAKDVLASLVIWLVGIPCVIVYTLLSQYVAYAMYMLLPVVFALQVMAMIGVAFVLSAVSVFLRDLKDFVQLFTVAGVFLMPIVYLPEWVPPLFKPVIYVNPFSYMTWVYQDLLYFGRFEHPWAWLVFGAGSILVFAFGYRVFRRLKPHFSSAL
jgi:lipopolysaccharide transport system permease protein